ncbi:hypothetical protein N431DRAFT_469779 [Stipitochalara longipes BDJ]|nr:hypothetical protein N431DRAFT_469779 [Stipitochalara longipes BDJ]
MAGIIGALTTTFTLAPSCIASFGDLFILQGGQYTVQGPVSANSCLPPNYDDSRGAYYSPGTCPSGYLSAAHSLNIIGTLTETAVTCCPPSMSANPSPFSPWELTMGCTSVQTCCLALFYLAPLIVNAIMI